MRRHETRFGHFELENVIGYGELGIVYRARNVETRERVALRILRPHHAGSEKIGELFLRGPLIASQIRHPNVVGVRELGNCEGKLYGAMEFVDGRPLAEALRGGPALEDRLHLIIRIARAVDHLHGRGVMHGDLTPANILLTAAGEPKITDFESAVLLAHEGDREHAEILRSGMVCGTPPYMAPEALRGNGPAFEPKRDVYALGAIAYRMVTGVMPYFGRDLITLMAQKENDPPAMELWDTDVAPRLEATIRRALAPAPEERWESADSFARALEGYFGIRRPAPEAAPRRAGPTQILRRAPLALRGAARRAACL